MRNFYHTCKISTLTINFSEVWPRQIVDLGKQFNLMKRLEKVWRHIWKTSSKRLGDVLKTSWKRLEDVMARRLGDVLKTSWKRLEAVLKTYGQDQYISLDQDVLKTSSEYLWVRRTYSSWSRRLQDAFKTSSSRRMFVGMTCCFKEHKKVKIWHSSTKIRMKFFKSPTKLINSEIG